MGSMHTGLEEPGMFGNLEGLAEFMGERARGEVGIIVTGGIAPNPAGRGVVFAGKMDTMADANMHRVVTDSVHDAGTGTKIVAQILHTGRYGYHWSTVSASSVKSPIGWSKPTMLNTKGVEETIDDFARCTAFAKEAGYDGVEIMGSEGYFINQFIAERVNNQRNDAYGGSYENRMRLPTEIVRRCREAVGRDFIIVYRLSMLDLVKGGSSWEEIVELAQRIEAAGATIINTGIGWHEARIPTIGPMVPRGAFTWVTQKLKGAVSVPLCTTNRINMPETAEDILASGHADMVSIARPLLADPFFVKKAAEGRRDEINTCIGCNQACLDHVFQKKRVSCLVNPRACFETTLKINRLGASDKKLRVAVVGAGPAGLSCATTAARRGHEVTLLDRATQLGGQFNMAKVVPGKEEFYETIRYFTKQLEITGVNVRLGEEATAAALKDFDAVVVATGVTPRDIKIPKSATSKVNVLSYIDVLKHNAPVGKSVALVGAGGIGFDIADFLTHGVHEGDSVRPYSVTDSRAPDTKVDAGKVAEFMREWGVDQTLEARAGLLDEADVAPVHSVRKVYLLQRNTGKPGDNLGKTTGWIHRTTMKKRAVDTLNGCKYVEINDEGFVIEQNGKKTTLPVDTVVICAGQEPLRELEAQLKGNAAQKVFMIGGAFEAGELDAKRAIDQGTRLGAVIETANSGEVFDAPVGLDYHLLKVARKYMKA
jgi:2,4-dienoyl-CoA reductase (NADPH2)